MKKVYRILSAVLLIIPMCGVLYSILLKKDMASIWFLKVLLVLWGISLLAGFVVLFIRAVSKFFHKNQELPAYFIVCFIISIGTGLLIGLPLAVGLAIAMGMRQG